MHYIPKYIAGSLWLTLLCTFSQSVQAQSVNVLHDAHSNSTYLVLLNENSIPIDSVQLKFVDFSFDSLVKVNDSTWHYFFLMNWDPEDGGMEIQRQLLVESWKDGLHMLFFSCYRLNILPEEDEYYGSFWRAKYSLYYDGIECSYFNFQSDNIVRTPHPPKGQHRFNDESSTVFVSKDLLFDKEKHVFYTDIDTLNGIYHYVPEEADSLVAIFKNEKEILYQDVYVPVLRIGTSYHIYLEGQWFDYYHTPPRKRIIKVIH